MPAEPSRDLPDPGFAGDGGEVAPEVGAALTAYGASGGPGHRAALAVLQHSRVLVPVVAVLGEVEHDEHGRAHDKTSDMATVLMTGQDGRTGLLAFTGTGPLRAWNPEARPVPVGFADAARAARQDGADVLLVDVAGPVLFVVEGEQLAALADGLTLVDLGDGWGWVRAQRPND
ncbi:SseB family protein [Nocardioides terrisoli]|uniref:SseB family protein n=1 Tax=Nocardioides terrisoli TaxID=3388267 RepID=UPI00287BA0AC|nr:SseB family protein [Nocardioides marmorisolisilvae]